MGDTERVDQSLRRNRLEHDTILACGDDRHAEGLQKRHVGGNHLRKEWRKVNHLRFVPSPSNTPPQQLSLQDH